jgi:hypothetical protein
MKRIVFAAAALLAACSSGGGMREVGGPPVAPRGVVAPSGPIELYDYRRGSEANVAQFFARGIERRYAVGLGLPVALADLRASQFACAASATGRGGDPPDQVCRRTITENDCTHTWQVHLWDDAPGAAQKVSRVRGLHDRRCKADDGLLGGPG